MVTLAHTHTHTHSTTHTHAHILQISHSHSVHTHSHKHAHTHTHTHTLMHTHRCTHTGMPLMEVVLPVPLRPIFLRLQEHWQLRNDFDSGTEPFNPLEQLMGVFPAASGNLMPESWWELMKEVGGGVGKWRGSMARAYERNEEGTTCQGGGKKGTRLS